MARTRIPNLTYRDLIKIRIRRATENREKMRKTAREYEQQGLMLFSAEFNHAANC